MKLNESIETIFRLQKTQKLALGRLGIESVKDLLYHFPARYEDIGSVSPIAETITGEKTILYGVLSKLKLRKAWKRRIPMAEARLTDDSGYIDIIWLNQAYIAKMFSDGMVVKVEGKVSEKDGKKSLINPTIERASYIPSQLQGETTEKLSSIPVYPESRGVTSRWIYYAIQKVLASDIFVDMSDPLPEKLLKKYNLPTLQSALVWIHSPKRGIDSLAARKRFAFEEVFLIQLKKHLEKHANELLPSFKIVPDKNAIDTFVKRFPFKPTKSQTDATTEIIKDISTPHAMSRLLEGDVGSGKTFVAAVTAHTVVTTRPEGPNGKVQDFGNLQVAYMAPTEILATQLFESFIEFFRDLPIQIGLITSSGCRKFPSKVEPNTWAKISRTQLLKWVENGEIPILVGTHSLIQKTVEFKHLACVIIDEQHRFGTGQRQRLTKKGGILPHLLSMTATPIPRTLALTIYGDLDLTLLSEMPAGRKPVITEIVPKPKREAMYEKLRNEIKSGRQAYVITPRIDEPDPQKQGALLVKSVKAEAKRLAKDVFPEFNVDVLHGKMTPKEKTEVMNKFSEGTIDILVATSVVEVGVNVINATTIIIESPERFGLAQLHQLRGRVLRSTQQAYCYLFPDTKSKHSLDRLKTLEKAKNGFALAEEDLKLRGAGELYGRSQWGISDIGMEAIKNIKMVEAARFESQSLVKTDPSLSKHKNLMDEVKQKREVHLE